MVVTKNISQQNAKTAPRRNQTKHFTKTTCWLLNAEYGHIDLNGERSGGMLVVRETKLKNMHTYIHTHIHKYRHTLHTYTNTYIHYIHTYTHTYINTYIHYIHT